MTADKLFARKILHEMGKIKDLRDLQWGQPLDYPTVDIDIDRELAGQNGVTPVDIGMSLQPAFFSSRFVNLSLWRDANSGFSYQVQVQVPQDQIRSKEDIEDFPTMNNMKKEQMPEHDPFADPGVEYQYFGSKTERPQHPLISDVAKVTYGTTNGEYDRYNMMRMVSLTANLHGHDLGRVGDQVKAAVKRAGTPPQSVFVKVTGQVPLLEDTFFHLLTGLFAGGCGDHLDAACILSGCPSCLNCFVDNTSNSPGRVDDVDDHWHHIERAVVHGRDHVDRCWNRQRNSSGGICRRQPYGRAQCGRSRYPRRREPHAPDFDDFNCHGCRYDTHGFVRRAERIAWPSRHWRFEHVDDVGAHIASPRFYNGAEKRSCRLTVNSP